MIGRVNLFISLTFNESPFLMIHAAKVLQKLGGAWGGWIKLWNMHLAKKAIWWINVCWWVWYGIEKVKEKNDFEEKCTWRCTWKSWGWFKKTLQFFPMFKRLERIGEFYRWLEFKKANLASRDANASYNLLTSLRQCREMSLLTCLIRQQDLFSSAGLYW